MSEEEKRKKAVALKYEVGSDAAPRVTAKGTGRIALKIIELATANNIPIHEDPDLTEVLSRVELGEEIPEDVYTVVAEILAFIYQANKKYPT